MKIQKVVMESDATIVVEKINKRDFNGLWNTDALLKDIEIWIRKFQTITIKYIPRSCNITANELALWGKNSMMDMFRSIPLVWLRSIIGRETIR
ncbi:hypothetical protein BVC80_1127g3 [Macleaya cordata]|uniref:RNase H type-1 domain-containing protein n=1 Tax=Macleaya cordata TaxID=56857 RepID=A0A200Q6J1_MACCD|nr:hypothetical protein BVC80_1127g3 [Macleaya cordata]